MNKRPLSERIDAFLLAFRPTKYIPIHPDDVEEAMTKHNAERYELPYRALGKKVLFGGKKQ